MKMDKLKKDDIQLEKTVSELKELSQRRRASRERFSC